jgi:hypothetical protein
LRISTASLVAGRFDDDRLEAAFEGAVLLDVLAILVERGRADALDLAARERRLEHVGRVDRPFRAAGSDQRVQLVDEQDHVSGRGAPRSSRLDALFELAAILGARDHHGQVEHHDAAIGEQLGDVPLDDAVASPSTIAVLPNAGLTEQHRVVLLCGGRGSAPRARSRPPAR